MSAAKPVIITSIEELLKYCEKMYKQRDEEALSKLVKGLRSDRAMRPLADGALYYLRAILLNTGGDPDGAHLALTSGRALLGGTGKVSSGKRVRTVKATRGGTGAGRGASAASQKRGTGGKFVPEGRAGKAKKPRAKKAPAATRAPSAPAEKTVVIPARKLPKLKRSPVTRKVPRPPAQGDLFLRDAKAKKNAASRRARRNGEAPPPKPRGTLYHGVAATKHAYRKAREGYQVAREAWRENPAMATSEVSLRGRFQDKLLERNDSDRRKMLYTKTYSQLIEFLRWVDPACSVDSTGYSHDTGARLTFGQLVSSILELYRLIKQPSFSKAPLWAPFF